MAFAAGNWTVDLTVTGERSASANQSLCLAGREAVSWALPDPYSVSGTITGIMGEAAACEDHVFAVFGPVAGLHASIAFASTTPIDFDYWLCDPDGNERADGYTFEKPRGGVHATPEDDLSIEEPEAGDWTVTACTVTAYGGGYRVVLTFE